MLRWFLPLLALGCGSPADSGPSWDDLPIRDRCFADVGDPDKGLPEYDDLGATIGRHCAGTNHQDIHDVTTLVFLGDSITAGTPPTDPSDFYRARLERSLKQKWPGLLTWSCAVWGAETVDLLAGDKQLETCFPDAASGPVLVVMTMGGNDLFRVAQRLRDGRITADEAVPEAEEAAVRLDAAMSWFEQQPERFPFGVSVVFGNVYEFTDGVGDLGSCPNAGLLGMDGTVPAMRAAYVAVNEGYMRVAVDHQRDMLFLLEWFCGHGFHADDPANECYRGDDPTTWFDGTCLHPTTEGHDVVAGMFEAVISDLEAVP